MNLLFITEISPFPINGGEKLRSYGILKLLSELNLNVHAIIGNFDDKEYAKYTLKGINITKYDYPGYNCKSLTRAKRLFNPDKNLLQLASEIIDHEQIDVIYIDYLFYGQYIPYFKKLGLPVIYGTHNSQANLNYQRPAVSFKNRIRLTFDFLVNRFHEIYYFRKADALIVVSENDRNYHRRFFGNKNIYEIPNFLIDEDYKNVRPPKKNHLIMAANFSAFQNYAGLEWFVNNVWDDELKKKTELHLVGVSSDTAYNELREKYPMDDIKAVGEVDDLKQYIAEARISVVPLLHGSGSRLKCLESMALETLLISTSKGAEGIDHNGSILIADTASEFKNCILQALEEKTNTAKNAREEYLKKYSLHANMKIFNQIVESITNPG
jgi:hypothetical protein